MEETDSYLTVVNVESASVCVNPFLPPRLEKGVKGKRWARQTLENTITQAQIVVLIHPFISSSWLMFELSWPDHQNGENTETTALRVRQAQSDTAREIEGFPALFKFGRISKAGQGYDHNINLNHRHWYKLAYHHWRCALCVRCLRPHTHSYGTSDQAVKRLEWV